MQFFLLITVLIFSVILTFFYRSFATKKTIIAKPNRRSLHEKLIPNGGGIVFSSIFIIAIFFLGKINIINFEMIMVLGFGGLFATIFGFVDDLLNLNALLKLFIQSVLASWILFWFEGGILVTKDWMPDWISWLISWFFLVWMINLYNFMDGIDGMAVSGAVFFSISMVFIILLRSEFYYLPLIFLLLALSCSGFLIYNWPPATLFMGDAGSVFLGYIFGALMIKTTMTGEISIWTWLILFGYYFADTNMTIFLRILLVKNWYHAHKSHAYQNLARIFNSHFKVTFTVLIFQLLYLLPIALWTIFNPYFAPYATIIAISPAIILIFRFGPIYSSE